MESFVCVPEPLRNAALDSARTFTPTIADARTTTPIFNLVSAVSEPVIDIFGGAISGERR
jgi:hypothetical protein